ncbi:MAG TPA: SusD/RagB family nutrient-binding outer membrane lipoprotein [Puia sp.]|nr:SusD/RagB family nutrient-binding outer membrane lipoprotein [Puia sp.]
MQRYKLIPIIFAGVFICITSCQKSYFTNLNNNPNVANSVTPNLLLPTVETGLAYTQGGDISRFSTLITQQTYGAASQFQNFYIYSYSTGAFDNLWADLYTTTMENDLTLMQSADAGNDNAYSGISRVLMAYTLEMTVDIWGDVPYSKAFQANKGGTLQPTFDKAQDLYDTVSNLIDAGITFLSNANAGTIVPGGDDIMYGGDETKWIKFAHAVKARLYIHQNKGNATMAASALTEIASSFAANSDNATYTFAGTATSENPWYQFQSSSRNGNVLFALQSKGVATPFAALLTQLNDPRYFVYLDSANDLSGQPAASPATHVGGLNEYYGGISAPVEFITYDEMLFAKAEAILNSGGSMADAQTAYQAAITANMQKLGVPAGAAATYIAANGTLPATTSDAIAKIALQEYIALYLNPEAWTLWRRTGSPVLNPTTGTQIPRRLLYPANEYTLNSANTPASTLFTPKIFWDN